MNPSDFDAASLFRCSMNTLLLELRLNPLEGMSRSEIVKRAIIRLARRRGNDKNVKANAQKTPSFIEPMKALPVEKLPDRYWLYEIKFDGYRALALKDGKDVRLVNRSGNHEWL